MENKKKSPSNSSSNNNRVIPKSIMKKENKLERPQANSGILKNPLKSVLKKKRSAILVTLRGPKARSDREQGGSAG